MSQEPQARACPNCGRSLPGATNFCPYCGHSFRPEPREPPAPQTTTTPTPGAPVAKPRSLPPIQPKRGRGPHRTRVPAQPAEGTPKCRFRWVDFRVLLGILGMAQLPLVLLLLYLLLRPPASQAPSPACERLDPAEFTPERYERGIGGELAEDTLFRAGTEYLIQKTLVIPKGRRLLIEPGASLVFDDGVGLEVRGGLYACGSGREPITFTGDTRKAGSWSGIGFYDADEDSVFNHVLVQFAGDRALYLENSAPALVDVKIASGTGFPISSDGNALPSVYEGVDLDENPFKGIEIRSGTLSEEAVRWSNHGLVYVLSGPLEIGADTALSIDRDTVVKFWRAPNGKAPGIWVHGLLKAEGVRFTSVHDSREEVGGVTYVEAQDPEPGDWVGIVFVESSAKSFLRGCSVQYAGQQQSGAISMQASSPEIADTTVADAAWYPLSVDADSFPRLEKLTFVDNEPGNALEVRGGSTITGRHERTWGLLGEGAQIVRVIRGDVTVGPEAALTIEPGVIIKFEENGRIIVQGTLRAIGDKVETGRIVFTSLRDGDYGGHTDKVTGPQDKRAWGGIVFDKIDNSSILQNCIVRYAPIVLTDASPRLFDNVVADNKSAAIVSSASSAPEVSGNRLEENGINGMAIQSTQISEDTSWAPLGKGDSQLVRILTGDVAVAEGAMLSIEPGTIVKIDANGKLRVLGRLHALGEASLPIVFTSLHDDGSGGDTDQSLREASAGDWVGVEIAAGARVRLANIVIRYAQTGLALHGGNVPVVQGELRISDGVKALWCDAEIEIPASFVVEGNEVNELRCPSR